MDNQELIAAIIFIGIGLLFFFNNKSIARGAAVFYQKLYTEKNLTIMFRTVGVVLVLGGIILILTR